MKKLKSLALTFSLATAGLLGLGATAQAQSVPLTPVTVTQTYQPELVTNNYVADEVVAAVSTLPMNRGVYPLANRGFTSARVDQTGENVGIEYVLNGGTKTPVRAYNLDDANGAAQFQSAINNANQLDLARRTPYYTPVSVNNYVYVRPISPIILFGPLFQPWHSHHVVRPYVYNPPRVYQQPRTTIIINTHGNNNHRDDYRGRDHHGGFQQHGGQQNHGGDRGGPRGPGGHRH